MVGLLELREFSVHHRPQLVERRVGYDLSDVDGNPVGTCIQTGRDNVDKLLHPKRIDNAQTAFDMCDGGGGLVLSLTHVRAFKSHVEVRDPNGRDLGTIRLRNQLGRSRFAVEVVGSEGVSLDARTWRNRNFVMRDGHGVEIAAVDMTHGSSGDHLHDNTYQVRVEQPIEEPMRSLAFAAVIAIDMIMWER